jgi:hypothetical protein
MASTMNEVPFQETVWLSKPGPQPFVMRMYGWPFRPTSAVWYCAIELPIPVIIPSPSAPLPVPPAVPPDPAAPAVAPDPATAPAPPAPEAPAPAAPLAPPVALPPVALPPVAFVPAEPELPPP